MRYVGTLILSLAACSALQAAEPPDLMNYQGVLRDAMDNPLNGSYDMVFRFWSAAAGGDEILIDRHTTLDSAPVTVTNGMFDVELGSGLVQDGAGPDSNGPYTTLHKVFQNYSTVWLEIEVNGELLSPRVRMRSAAYAFNSMHLGGIIHNQYLNETATAQTKIGPLSVDTFALPATTAIIGSGRPGGYFEDADLTSHAFLGSGYYGIRAFGDDAGGYFEDENGSGAALAGFDDYGLYAYGNLMGGYFEDSDGVASASIASAFTGVQGYGGFAGGYFEDADSPTVNATLGSGGYGVQGTGTTAGGSFDSSNGSGSALLAWGDRGVHAIGSDFGGFFANTTQTGEVFAGYGHFGIDGRGSYQSFRNGGGGRFEDLTYTGVAYVAHGNLGIYAEGSQAGGEFRDIDTGNFGQVGRDIYKVFGTGTVSFVQNHPEQTDKVIVYHAPEASEVAVYTRGSARLVDGTARIALDPTFQWTTNPDLGLTAHLTPRGAAPDLHVTAVTTTELVVSGSTDVEFDYMVWGLRIGFEESAPVQDKLREARIPAMTGHRALYAKDDTLRRFNALERYRGIEARLRGVDPSSLDTSRAAEMVARIGEHDPGVRERPEAGRHAGSVTPRTAESLGSVDSAAGGPAEPLPDASSPSRIGSIPEHVTADGALAGVTWLPVAEPVEAGDVLALDPLGSGQIRRANSIADPNVIGIAAGPVRTVEDGSLEAPVANGRYATVKVDAGYGEIPPGEWLVASPTPGHAMRALEHVPGTILGKALERLDSGTGTIRVLVSPR